jgi:hypothetical protein
MECLRNKFAGNGIPARALDTLASNDSLSHPGGWQNAHSRLMRAHQFKKKSICFPNRYDVVDNGANVEASCQNGRSCVHLTGNLDEILVVRAVDSWVSRQGDYPIAS